ncbi:hypothetical protein SETIT_5G201000v2 [Setaria italica]|uniref:Uncharacterized protein n=1 Tax=Setaria italica TaxID=4555 RepID=A0A368R6R5_SETIT|nr:hypothetical protein SETIT_5G201000v2 [Setaria italica]
MANFAARIKDKFLGLVDRVAGYGRIGGEKDKVQEPAKLHSVQVIAYALRLDLEEQNPLWEKDLRRGPINAAGRFMA